MVQMTGSWVDGLGFNLGLVAGPKIACRLRSASLPSFSVIGGALDKAFFVRGEIPTKYRGTPETWTLGDLSRETLGRETACC